MAIHAAYRQPSMSHRLPPLSWLRTFEAAARHLNFTHAAHELHLTQAAVSKQIRLLEGHLGEALFQRRPRRLILTQAGAAYLPKVRDAFERLSAGTEEVFGHQGKEILTVRCSSGFSVNWLAPRLGRFFTQYPHTPVRIVSSVWSDSHEKEHCHLDIRYGRGHWPQVYSERLTYEMLEPLCAPAKLRGANALNDVQDLANERLLHVLGYLEGWGLWLAHAGVPPLASPSAGVQFDTSLLAFEVAAQGHGIALGRSSMATQEIASGRLIRPFDNPYPVHEAFYLLSPKEDFPHPDATIFKTWLLAEAQLCADRRHPDFAL